MSPEPARTLDLDSARAARLEKVGKPPVIKWGGKRYTLPVELPAEFAFAYQEDRLKDAVSTLFGGPEEAEEFFAGGPSIEDLMELADGVAGLYGIAEGESEASGGRSRNGGGRSRPTSNGTTG